MIQNQLKLRILTASFLIPVTLLCIFLPKTEWIFAPLFFYAGIEWARMMRFSLIEKIVFLSVLVLGLVGIVGGFNWLSIDLPYDILLKIITLSWGSALLILIRYQRTPFQIQDPWIQGGLGLLILCLAYWAVIFLKYHSVAWFEAPYALLYLLFVVWSMDTGAYFIGKIWGRHPLASQISPKKTLEGLLGGLLMVLLLAVVTKVFIFQHLPSAKAYWLRWLLWNFWAAVASVIGDLFESLLKRMQGLKDSGNLLPGHGGLLDRIDSLLATLPLSLVGNFLFF